MSLSFVTVSFHRVHTTLLLILLEGSPVSSGLRIPSVLPALTHVPMNKGPPGIHQVRCVVQARSGLSPSCAAAQRAHSSLCSAQPPPCTEWEAGNECQLQRRWGPSAHTGWIHWLSRSWQWQDPCLWGPHHLGTTGRKSCISRGQGPISPSGWLAPSAHWVLCCRQLLLVGVLSRHDGNMRPEESGWETGPQAGL